MTGDQLIEYARDELAMPMRGRMMGAAIGYTTDAAKAEQLRRHGARVTALPMKFGPSVGYEVAIVMGDVELLAAA